MKLISVRVDNNAVFIIVCSQRKDVGIC